MPEAVTEVPYWRIMKDKSPVSVKLQPLKKDVNGSSASISLQVNGVVGPGSNCKGRTLSATTLCC